MSRRKRDVAYLKPEEPAFITRMKNLAGYKEGPTVDTKREQLPCEDEDFDDHEDEQPQIVVVKDGDLTAEEASKIKRDIEEGPADLSQRVVFKKPDKVKRSVPDALESSDSVKIKKIKKGDTKGHSDATLNLNNSLKTSSKSVLSFTEEDDEDS